ncbi:putative inactive 1-aminocyclopropane-1-carboxylate synthase-like protein 2 [Talaromyces islandicus]|uniref:Putative inactive 1-aminocyclopropane-1-carboxylate synthase-like protein 2 n=1 Tax=Talaromyces islandicus TaxID=28573 RepID=A0A0U1LRY6_TALIS|nr:putative inactive 1-aminocyclopropane-1-carboxylate synthase-like protein 2 [Talaromyces islandicus]
MQSNVSSRGLALAPKVPVFFDVLKDLWDPESNPNGTVNLGLAENCLTHTELERFINCEPRANYHALTYGDGFSGSKDLKKALCHFMNRHFHPHRTLMPPHMCITSGASNAIENCAWALCDPGDCILVGRPYFTTFRSIFGNRAGVNIIEVNFGAIDPFSLEAVEEYGKAFFKATEQGQKIKAILLCSPNNPLGRCYPEEVLKAYMILCQKLSMHLISDELYGLSVWDNPEYENPTPFTSVLSIDTENLIDPQKVHVVWGMRFWCNGTTDWNTNQPVQHDILESVLFNFPSSLADNTAASLFLNEGFSDQLVSLNRARLSENYQYAVKVLRVHGIPYQNSNAALFIWVNLGAVVNREKMTDEVILQTLRREKLYITSGSTYASEQTGWFRIVFAHPKHVLDEGLKRLIHAIM